MVTKLTPGVLWACMNGEQAPQDPYIQILSFKKVVGLDNQDRFRLHISDGEFSLSFAMLATQLNKLIYEDEIESFAVVKVKKMMINTMNNKKVIILLELEVVAKGSEVGMKIGNPTAWVEGMPRPQVAKSGISHSSSARVTKLHSTGAPPTTPKRNKNGSSSKSRFNSNDSPPSATKKPKMENINIPKAAIMPIRDIALLTNRVTIRARVTNKSDVKIWTSGKGKLFSIDLLDESGEIRMTGFNTSVEKFYEMIQVDHVYYISRFSVKLAKKQFTSIRHKYELSMNNDTKVVPCVDDTSAIPVVTYDFVPIADIEHVDADKTIDVMGVCQSFANCESVIVRSTGKEVKKRELVLIDQSGVKISLTIWGTTAEEFSDDKKPIIAVKGVKVSDFGGKSLSCLSSALFQVNPNLEEAHDLRRWYDSEGSSLSAQSLTSYYDSDSDDDDDWPHRGGPW